MNLSRFYYLSLVIKTHTNLSEDITEMKLVKLMQLLRVFRATVDRAVDGHRYSILCHSLLQHLHRPRSVCRSTLALRTGRRLRQRQGWHFSMPTSTIMAVKYNTKRYMSERGTKCSV